MAIDASVFDKIKTFTDYQQADEAFQLKKQLAAQQLMLLQSGARLPAALQLSNEYQRRIQAGDIEGANVIAQFAKTQDKGVTVDANGNYQPLPGYAPAISSIEGAKAGAKEQAEKNVDLNMNPQIKYGESKAGATGTAEGTAEGNIKKKYINAPQLETYLSEAEKLLPNATSGGLATIGRDSAAFFGNATEGSKLDSRLNVIGGALTMGVPRMEGPQSDKDALLYKQAAGDLANSKLPRETRLSAIQTIRDLNQKYLPGGNAGAVQPAANSPTVAPPTQAELDEYYSLTGRKK